MRIIELTQQDVYEVLCQILPKQNDFAKSDYSEELEDLNVFGIQTKVQLLDLVAKHRKNVLRIDEEPLDDFHVKAYKEEYGNEYVEKRIKNKFWFAYPALLRIILELEFGNKYKVYADKRDNV